jgi:hypothetical protein
VPDAITQITPLDQMIASELPGLGEYQLPTPCKDKELERLPVHTAERFRAAEPKTYAIAVALFFGERMSILPICKALRISPHTLLNIIAREMRGATAEAWRSDLLSRLRVGGTLAISALTNLLMDDDSVQIAGIKGVAMAQRELSHAHELLSGRPTDRRESVSPLSTKRQADDYISRLKPAEAMDCGADNSGASREVGEQLDDGQAEVQHD